MLNPIKKIRPFFDSIFEKYFYKISYNQKLVWLQDKILHDKSLGISKEKIADKEVIVSLTTYGERYNQVYITIESLMQQTIKANRIILWLDNSFMDKPLLPILKRQTERGLEIRYCKDLGSYKKLIPALKEFPESIIITTDDDVIYNIRMIEKLVNAYNNNPHFIYCNRMHRIKLGDSGVLPYREWEKGILDVKQNILNFPVGIGGILYPPYCFNDEIFNEEFFLKNCPNGDDIWFKAMALLNNFQAKKAEVSFTQDDYWENDILSPRGLQKENVEKNLNDIKFKNVFNSYLKNILK